MLKLVALVLFLGATEIAVIAQSTDLTEFQKETITSIREVTLQLLLLAVGVFALMGGFASGENREFRYIRLGWTAFLALGASVVAGLIAYGSLIYSLGKNSFEPFSGVLRFFAASQWVTFGLGGMLFMLFVLRNLKNR